MLTLGVIALSLSACDKQKDCDGNAIETYTLDGFTRVVAGSAMRLHITKGNTYSIRAEGCRRDIGDLRLQLKPGQALEIDFDENRVRRDEVRIDITLPHLLSVSLSGASRAQVDGFANNTSILRMMLSGASSAVLDGTAGQTQVELSGASRLQASGQTTKIFGNISGGSELRALEVAATEVDLTTSGGSTAFVHAGQILRAEASGGSRVVYRGAPQVKEIVTSGGGQVLPE